MVKLYDMRQPAHNQIVSNLQGELYICAGIQITLIQGYACSFA
jgi:hypothetical protein